MKNMKLIAKLLLGFGMVALIVMAVGYFGLTGATDLSGSLRDIGEGSMPSLEYLMIIDKAMMTVDDSENALMVKGLTQDLQQSAYAAFDTAKKTADDAIKAYGSLPMSGEEATLWKQFIPAFDAWWKDHETLITMAKDYESSPTDENYNKLTQWGLSTGMASFDAVGKVLTPLIQLQKKEAADTVAKAETSAARVHIIAIVGIIAGPLIAVLLGIFFALSITKQVGGEPAVIADLARKVADGDLSMHLDNGKRQATGIFSAIKDMIVRLNDVMHNVQEASSQVASSSEEISSSAQQLASGAQNQASTLEETSASVEELTASVEQVSDHAQSQAASVEESSSNMAQMQSSVQQVSKTLNEVSTSSQDSMQKAQAGAQAVTKAVEAIKAISSSSEQIAGIINVISDIADQTNLLALNASIEAARAGEHGRGFAVVADEVSKLADRSATSTKEIEGLIKESGKSVNAGVEIAQAALAAMEAIIAGAQKTNQMVSALAGDIEQQIGAIKEVAKATESISEMSQSISAATEEQTTNAKQVSKAIENVNELTQQAASAAEEMSAATEELSTLAQQMQRQVEQFKLSEDGARRELLQPAVHAPVHTAAHAAVHVAAHAPAKTIAAAAAGKHLFTPAGQQEVTAVTLKKGKNGEVA